VSSVPDDSYLDRIVDEDALAQYLKSELGPAETYTIERHQQGHSNETLFVTWGERTRNPATTARRDGGDGPRRSP